LPLAAISRPRDSRVLDHAIFAKMRNFSAHVATESGPFIVVVLEHQQLGGQCRRGKMPTTSRPCKHFPKMAAESETLAKRGVAARYRRIFSAGVNGIPRDHKRTRHKMPPPRPRRRPTRSAILSAARRIARQRLRRSRSVPQSARGCDQASSARVVHSRSGSSMNARRIPIRTAVLRVTRRCSAAACATAAVCATREAAVIGHRSGSPRALWLSKNYRSKCGSVFDTHFLKDMIKVISYRSF
jgi:hypothetical protein